MRYVTGMKLLDDGPRSVILGINLPVGASVLTDEDVVLGKRLCRHLTDALRQHQDRMTQVSHGALGMTVMERLGFPALLLDEQRRSLHANPAARRLLQDGDTLRLEGGLLRCARAGDDAALLFALRDLALAGDSQIHGVSPRDKVFLRVRSEAIPPAQLGLYLLALRPGQTLNAFGNRAVAMLLVHDPRDRGPTVDPFMVAAAFDLTPAEARVATALARGAAPKAIAAGLGVSLHTVKTHFANLFLKTGTARQSELVRAVMGLPIVGLALSEPGSAE